jgi:hypothetical protein
MLKIVENEAVKEEGYTLDALAREGARRMLMSALEEEVAAYATVFFLWCTSVCLSRRRQRDGVDPRHDVVVCSSRGAGVGWLVDVPESRQAIGHTGAHVREGGVHRGGYGPSGSRALWNRAAPRFAPLARTRPQPRHSRKKRG